MAPFYVGFSSFIIAILCWRCKRANSKGMHPIIFCALFISVPHDGGNLPQTAFSNITGGHAEGICCL